MILSFFSKKYKLSDRQSEILKVAILDAIKQAENDQDNFAENSKEHHALQTKVAELNSLAELFGIVNV